MRAIDWFVLALSRIIYSCHRSSSYCTSESRWENRRGAGWKVWRPCSPQIGRSRAEPRGCTLTTALYSVSHWLLPVAETRALEEKKRLEA